MCSRCLQPTLGGGRSPHPGVPLAGALGIKPVSWECHCGGATLSGGSRGSVHAHQVKPAPSREVTGKDKRRKSKEKQG